MIGGKNWWDSKFINSVVASAFFILADKLGCDPSTVLSIATVFGIKILKQGAIDEKKAGAVPPQTPAPN